MTLDPIDLQVVTGALRAACEEMGAVLVRSAHSANIKERRDCSSGLFDADGEMVMQAEHIPVHLGAMPAAVAAVLGEDHSCGRPWILNDPFRGGTHLPDITVITPVLADDGALLGFAANRAHHADVGGRVPGSMPADSTTLDEEGVVIAPRVLDDVAIDELVARMRQPAQRRADLRAQLAANRIGVQRLSELARRLGAARLRESTAAVLDYAERRTRACIAALPDGPREARDVLEGIDGDIELRLVATVDGDRLILDFAGSAAQDRGNLNCPLAVTRSAAYFAVRVLTDPDVPASAGAYRPIDVRAPEGSLLNAGPRADGVLPAVAGGNVETSSRVADLVLAAFGRACGQGTMNNITLGTDGTSGTPGFTYYETLGGGQGACPDAAGPSGVHVAMSNTLNTPVEALELEFPLRVVRHAIRRGSGGAGCHAGGEGIVRELEALAPMSYALITERRRHAPPGADGGEPGARGRNLLNGDELAAKATGELVPGDRLAIETPGGGGHGVATARLRGVRPAPEHAGLYAELFADEAVAARLWPPPLGGARTREQARELLAEDIEDWERHGYGPWAFFEADGGRFAGRGGIAPTAALGPPATELLFAVRADAWGRGYATEMAAAGMRFAAQLGLPEVVAFCLASNVASRRLIERAGLRSGGTLEHAGLPHMLAWTSRSP